MFTSMQSTSSLPLLQWWKVTKYIYFSTVLEYISYAVLYISTPLHFGDTYCNFYLFYYNFSYFADSY